ncbi:MAG: hypothetical protein K0S91_3235 [Nitrososphaeraceae archaeon]|nr:hypothetical protein [Nitrososphaeraceae archaeon]
MSKVRPEYFERGVRTGTLAEPESGEGNKANNVSYDSFLFDKKIALAVEGLEPFFDRTLRQRTLKENAIIIAEYINTAIREANISKVIENPTYTYLQI